MGKNSNEELLKDIQGEIKNIQGAIKELNEKLERIISETKEKGSETNENNGNNTAGPEKPQPHFPDNEENKAACFIKLFNEIANEADEAKSSDSGADTDKGIKLKAKLLGEMIIWGMTLSNEALEERVIIGNEKEYSMRDVIESVWGSLMNDINGKDRQYYYREIVQESLSSGLREAAEKIGAIVHSRYRDTGDGAKELANMIVRSNKINISNAIGSFHLGNHIYKDSYENSHDVNREIVKAASKVLNR